MNESSKPDTDTDADADTDTDADADADTDTDAESVPTRTRRRRFLRGVGASSVAALAGCLGLGEDDADAQAGVGRSDDWCVSENDVEVPDAYRTAESIDGIERDPDDLTDREGAAYQCHPQGYQLCANCRYFIPGKHEGGGDEGGAGACAIVEGIVRSQDWCALYQPREKLAEFPHPDPIGTDGQQKAPDIR